MFTHYKCLLIALVIASCSASANKLCAENEFKTPIHETILSSFKNDVKTMYKVWHYIFNKQYDYNTIQGLNRFKTFKARAKEIEEHNKSNSSWKKGFNHLSDMTSEEILTYYNIKPLPANKLKSIRKLSSFNLDDYNDEEDVIPNPTGKRVQTSKYTASDHRPYMRPVRDQGNCGSCWAFATQAVLEGVFGKREGAPLKDWLSTQQLVDCDTGNGGCNGGWYDNAMNYLKDNVPMWESDYPYKAVRTGSCAYNNNKTSEKKIAGHDSYYEEYGDDANLYVSMIARGPVAVAVNVDNQWFQYSTGIFKNTCQNGVNHAVVVVGYQPSGKCSPGHFIIRNSWGSGWGEDGHIRIADDNANSKSCNVERFGFQAN